MLNLTNEERKVVLFLAGVIFIGIGLNFALKQIPPDKSVASFSTELIKLDLNSADKKLLMGISGIGETIAQRILDYREKQEFAAVEDLKNIKGISQSKFERIKHNFVVQ